MSKVSGMKKIVTMVLILCLGAFFIQLSGQQANTQKNEKKGGFAVGGGDNTRQQEVKKRSIDLDEEVEASEKAEEAVPALPVPPVQATVPQDTARAGRDNAAQGNAYGQDKGGLEGKDFGQARSQAAREKQKAKKIPKSKAKRR